MVTHRPNIDTDLPADTRSRSVQLGEDAMGALDDDARFARQVFEEIVGSKHPRLAEIVKAIEAAVAELER